jgi:hypothetical protein
MQTLSTSFAKDAAFTPRFSIIDGSRFDCDHTVQSEGPCDHLCSNHGRYCALHANDLSGHAIVKETLRRLCVWNHFPEHYFSYVIYHLQHCREPHLYADEECLGKAPFIDSGIIETCITESGGLEEDAPNTLLEAELHHQLHSGVVSIPAVTVNHKLLESPHPANVFDAVCDHFWLETSTDVPEICATW